MAWAQFEDYNQEEYSEVKAQLCKFFETESYISNDILLTVYNPDLNIIIVDYMTLSKIEKNVGSRSCLINAGRMLLFMIEQVFQRMLNLPHTTVPI